MRHLALSAALAALAIAAPTAAQAQRTPAAVVVVVDTDSIFRDCTACRAAQPQLQGLVTAARTRAQQLGQPLQTEAQSIKEAADAAQKQSGAARTAAETALNTRAQAFQQRQTAAQQEIAGLEQNVQSTQANVVRQINAAVGPIYSQVMAAHGANLAVDVNATLAHASAVDVTAEVLNALNAALPSVSVTPLPAQQAPQPSQTPAQPR
jgi:outer membrane protein